MKIESGDMAQDSGILELPFKKLELSKTSNEVVKKLGLKTVGDIAKVKPEEILSASDNNERVLLEIQTSMKDMGVAWGSDEIIKDLLSKISKGPLQPSLPAKILQLEKKTYVCTSELTLREANTNCAHCNKPMIELFCVNLAELNESHLPAQIVSFQRCQNSSCLLKYPLPLGIYKIENKKEASRIKFRLENSYPAVEDIKPLPSEKTTEALLSHYFDVVGTGPRFGGWPGWPHSLKDKWPKCSICQSPMILLFEEMINSLEIWEHLFTCEKSCKDSFFYCTSMD